MRMPNAISPVQMAALAVGAVLLVLGLVWVLDLGGSSGDPVDPEPLVFDDTPRPSTTTTTTIVEPTVTEWVEQVSEAVVVQETTERYPVVAPGTVECSTDYVHVHPAILDAHVEGEAEHQCHAHTCETEPHGPEIAYSGETWPCTVQQDASDTPTTTTTAQITTTTAQITTTTSTKATESTASESVTTTEAPEATEPEVVNDPDERVDGGSPLDLARYGDECAGTLTGRYPLGQPTGCVLDNGAVLCLAATHSPQGDLLYNAAEWQLCPGFDPARPPCPTTHDAAGHGYIERWEHVWTSDGRERGVRGLSEVVDVIDLEPGLYFGELCVRNNEGSQIGRPGPQQVTAGGLGNPYCSGLGGFSSNVDGRLVLVGNGTVNLFENHTGRLDTAVFRCSDREGPYSYTITVGVPGDWVLRLGKADLGFEVGTYDESGIEVRTWFRDAFVRNNRT